MLLNATLFAGLLLAHMQESTAQTINVDIDADPGEVSLAFMFGIVGEKTDFAECTVFSGAAQNGTLEIWHKVDLLVDTQDKKADYAILEHDDFFISPPQRTNDNHRQCLPG